MLEEATMKNILRKRHGQGTTEYIVILGIAVALAVGIFWSRLKQPLQNKVIDISNKISAPS